LTKTFIFATKQLWLAGHVKAADEFRDVLDGYLLEAVEKYADNELSEEDFEERRITASKEVARLFSRYNALDEFEPEKVRWRRSRYY